MGCFHPLGFTLPRCNLVKSSQINCVIRYHYCLFLSINFFVNCLNIACAHSPTLKHSRKMLMPNFSFIVGFTIRNRTTSTCIWNSADNGTVGGTRRRQRWWQDFVTAPRRDEPALGSTEIEVCWNQVRSLRNRADPTFVQWNRCSTEVNLRIITI